MSSLLPRFEATRDSGVSWLGTIPKHWGVQRGKTFLSTLDVRSETGEEELLTVSSRRGVVPRSSTSVTMFKASSYVGHKLCWPGDLVINSLWAWSRGLGVSRHHGIVSTAYGVYRLRDLTRIHPDYLHKLVRSTPFNWELRVRSKGIWISRLQLTDEAFLGAPLPIPPLPEQTAIVRFLDYVDQRIRRYIRAKEKLIALLEEQKQAVIHQTVTGQIDLRTGRPYSAYKDSAVEWLGEVPGHWRMRRLGRLVDLTVGFPFKSEGFSASDSDVRLLRGINISPGRVRWENVVRWPSSDILGLSHYALDVGDIVLGMDRPIVARGTRVAEVLPSDVPSLLLQRVARVRPREPLHRLFLLHLLSGRTFSDYLAPIFTGISVPHLSPDQIKEFPFALPPLDEQRQIIEHLQMNAHVMDAARQRAGQQIAVVREFRDRLLTDVVTGRLDVRGAVASLPGFGALGMEIDEEGLSTSESTVNREQSAVHERLLTQP